jgi:iron complex transport system permease protein
MQLGYRTTSYPKHFYLIIALSVLTIAIVVLSLSQGSVTVPINDIWLALWQSSDRQNQIILWDLRLPRLLLSMLVGEALGIAGALLQGVLRNGLADPFVLGISAGAGLIVVILIFFGVSAAYFPISAWIGAIVTMSLIFLLSYRRGIGLTTESLILAGIAINSLLGSVQTILFLLLEESRIQTALNWLIGSFNGRGWSEVIVVAPYTLIGTLIAMALAKALNTLSLGDEVAASLGLTVWRSRVIIGVVASLLAACAVSVSGLIGFVGLVVPHLVRLIVGSDYRWLIPLSGWSGACLLSGADLLARSNGVELPVGAIMALVGAPVFIWILYHRPQVR